MNRAKTEKILKYIDRIMEENYSASEWDDALKQELENLSQNHRVDYDFYIYSCRRKPVGKIILFFKRLIRKLLRWCIAPMVEQQNKINASMHQALCIASDALSALNNEIEERRQIEEKLTGQLEAMKAELTEQLGKTEEKLMGHLEATKAELTDRLKGKDLEIESIREKLDCDEKALDLAHENEEKFLSFIHKCSLPDIDYASFEDKFRGTREYILERQSIYIDIFKGRKQVLDLGCGRGEFLELCKENEIEAKGIDLSDQNIIFCNQKNVTAICCDIFEYLESLPDNSVGGIFCAQVIEHFTSAELVEFVRLAYRKLWKGAPIVLETINPKNVVAVSNWFYMDLTHVRPVHPDTLDFLIKSSGYELTEVWYLHPDEGKGMTAGNAWAVNEALFGPQDYAMIAYK